MAVQYVQYPTISGSVLGQKLMAASSPVVIASDQSAVPVTISTPKTPINLNGSGSGASDSVSVAKTLTAPANAVGFILMNLNSSTADIRWGIGRVASATLGSILEAGRDTGFVPCGANVSVCAVSGTQNIDIQWISQ